MSGRVLSLREINRATLDRQMLLNREELSIQDAIRRLGGLQAQVPNPPYIGLWTRLRGFRRTGLERLLEERRIVRAPFLRSTLHLVTAGDYVNLQPAVRPALRRALRSFFGRQLEGADLDRLLAAARIALEEKPRSFAELRSLLSDLEPGKPPEALAYAVRSNLPLVQVYPGGSWGSGGSVAYALVEPWLGEPLPESEDPRRLILRYLAAFGPATVKDVQAWSGMVRLKDAVEDLRQELRSFRDERGNELLDLPNLPLPQDLADTPPPPRFLPEYDNLLLSHADRRRVIPDEYRPKVFLSAARVRATFLVDGFVRGAWRVEKSKDLARLTIEPFEHLPDGTLAALAEEAEELIRFIAGNAASDTPEVEVRLEDPRNP